MTLLLAFDTATPQVTVALHDGTSVVAELISDRAMKHGEQLAPLIESALTIVDAGPADLTRIAVGVGPGPFTGLRVGLVTARTLGLALDLPIDGVGTLDILALEAIEDGVVDGPFLVATDARRREVYAAAYSATGVRVAGPIVEHPATLVALAEFADLVAGPAVGEGASLYPDTFPSPVGPERPSAGWLARGIVAGRLEVVAPEPLYLRRPDAVAAAER